MNAAAQPQALAAVTSEVTISNVLAQFATGLRYEDIPAAVIERAKLHVLDCIGIGLASSGFDFGQRTINALVGLAGDGPYPVLGTPLGLPLRDALLANGTLIHGLDFDDTHSGGVIHASASAVPVMLGIGQREHASGREALAAYLVGVEASSRIGQAAKNGFHLRGFHPTGLVGAFGATLAAGRLSGMNPAQLAHAQGIVLSMASGSLEFLEDGAWTKRMHPGWAASSAATACALARTGFVGPKRPYEGRFGLFNAFVGAQHPADPALCIAALGETWEMLNVAMKPYPACHFNHAFADAALELRRKHAFELDDIASITARIGAGQTQVVCEPQASKRRPQNAYDAQFSVHYIIATALARGRFTLTELEEDALADPRVLALTLKTSYEIDPDSAFPRYYSGEVVLRLKDGRELRHREAQNRGSDARPLAAEEIVAKFHGNAGRVMSRPRAERVVDAVLALDRAATLDAVLDAVCTN
ncbi:MAG: MmgE/PrpD family protein [Betaproteobacteria bacterium]|nr:MmgE/PrpD family protein [Betaproteobacteria bacterium]